MLNSLIYLHKSFEHDGNCVGTVVRKSVGVVVHVVRPAPVVLHTRQVNLQKLLLVDILVPCVEVRENRLCGVHAVDLAEEEVLVLPRLVASCFHTPPFRFDALPVKIPHLDGLCSLHRILRGFDDAGERCTLGALRKRVVLHDLYPGKLVHPNISEQLLRIERNCKIENKFQNIM